MTKSPKAYRYLLPEGIDIDKLTKECVKYTYYDLETGEHIGYKRTLPTGNNAEHYINNLIVSFIGMIYYRTPKVLDENGDLVMLDMHIQVNKKMVENLNRFYGTVKSFLTKYSDIFDIDHSYQTGVRSKGFKFSKKYFNTPTKEYFCKDKRFIARVDKIRKQTLASDDVFETTFGKCKIDFLGAIEYITERHRNGTYTDSEYIAYYSTIDRLYRQDLTYTYDTFSGRLHTNVTSIKKELRQFLYFEDVENDDIVDIDIKNSQVMLTGLILDRNNIYKIKNVLDHNLNNSFIDLKHLDKIYEFYTKNNFDLTSDVLKFRKNAFDGKLYEMFAKEIKDCGLYERLARNKTKKMFLVWLFSPKGHEIFKNNKTINKLNKFLKQEYPNLLKIIDFFREFTDDLKFIPRLLQNIEATVNIKIIGKELKPKKAVYATIHDSYLTPTCCANDVIKAIKKIYKSYFNIDVKLKIQNINTGQKFKDTTNETTYSFNKRAGRCRKRLLDAQLKHGMV